jgi:hypothetical protein
LQEPRFVIYSSRVKTEAWSSDPPFTNEERHEKKDLEEDYANIGEYAPELGKKYSDYYGDAMKAGELSEREKALVAKETKRTSWAQG